MSGQFCQSCTPLSVLDLTGGLLLQNDAPGVHFLHNSLDNGVMARYACSRPELITSSVTTDPVMPISARRVSLLNPGNNRPLPQNLWDVIERFG
jgi:hypothetical protein